MTSHLPMTDQEFTAISKEVRLLAEGVPLPPVVALALLAEANRARTNERYLIARLRALEVPGAESGDMRRSV